MTMTDTAKDEVIEEVRSIREAYAQRFDYNIALLFHHAMELLRESDWKTVKRQPKPVEETHEAKPA
jgi:hypothetical protein